MKLIKYEIIFSANIMWQVIFSDSQKTAIDHLVIQVNRLSRVTNGLQKDVHDIWAALTNTAVNSEISKQVCNETEDPKIFQDNILKIVNESLLNVSETKADIEEFIVYAQKGLKNEKTVSRKSIHEMESNIDKFDFRIAKMNSDLSIWQQDFKRTIELSLKETLDNLKASMEEENRLFQQKMHALVNVYKDKVEQNEKKADAYFKRLEENIHMNQIQSADLKNQLEVFKDVVNEKLACDSGWKKFEEKCYLFVTKTKTWQKALEFCQSMNSHLVDLEGTAKTDFLMQHCDHIYSVWVGANDEKTEGTFIWEDSKQTVSQEYFNRGEPNGGRHENCAELYCQRNKKLNDSGCRLKKHFFCEKQAFTL